MNVSQLIEYLSTLDGDLQVEIGDSHYPSQPLEEVNIVRDDGVVVFY